MKADRELLSIAINNMYQTSALFVVMIHLIFGYALVDISVYALYVCNLCKTLNVRFADTNSKNILELEV